MNWNELKRWYQVKRNDTIIRTTPSVIHSESMDSLTQTAGFTLIDQQAFVGNTPVTIELVDLDAGITRVIFDGTYDASEVESAPQEVAITSAGPLALLRNVRKEADGDYLISGVTDGNLVEYVLEYCGIGGGSHDIDDAGYVLGEHADLWWRVGEPGSTIIEEVDAVFGSKTFEVGDLVVRRFYDLAPDDTGAYRTFTKGADFDLWAAHVSLGRRDEIQSSWSVRGVSVPCGPQGACTCTPWAKASSANPALGSKKFRVATQSFDSDMIQSSSLAESIVQRLMRWYNRRAYRLSLTHLVDKNIHPTSVIGLVDPTPHIDADPVRYFTVQTVDRNQWDQTLQAVGGDAGAVGTVTSGTEMICNGSEDSEDWDTPYTDPDTSFPPIDPGDPFGDLPDLSGLEELEPPPPPDTTSPFIGCAIANGMSGTVSPGSISAEGLATWLTVEDSVWRIDDPAATGVHLTDGVIDEIRVWAGDRTFWLNLTPGFDADKEQANDEMVGVATRVVVSGEFWFKESNPSDDFTLVWHMEKYAGVLDARAELYADPGFDYDNGFGSDHFWAVRSQTEHKSPITSEFSIAGQCTHLTLNCNTGAFMGKDLPIPVGEWIPFTVAFDLTTELQRIDVVAGAVEGYNQDPECWGTTCQNPTSYSTTTFDHYLRWDVLNTPTGGDITDPDFKIRGLSVGYDTCTPNPDYVPPSREQS